MPCGTHETTGVGSEDTPSTTTCIDLLVRKHRSQSCMGPSMPYERSLWSNLLWGTVSKALEKSNMAMSS